MTLFIASRASTAGSGRESVVLDWMRTMSPTFPGMRDLTRPDALQVRATEIVGAERDRVFADQANRFEVYRGYERSLERTIPVIRFDPIE